METGPDLVTELLLPRAVPLSEHFSPLEISSSHAAYDHGGDLSAPKKYLEIELYVPSHPLLEPISPAEEPETCDLSPLLPKTQIQPEVLTNEDSNSVTRDSYYENQGSPVESRVETSSSVNTGLLVGKEKCVRTINCSPHTAVRKNIPPKKDKFNPLKLDASTVIPLTSSQISLQCVECHIIFSDTKSKIRHLRCNHPDQYLQANLSDALFFCYVCDQHFSCSAELTAHQRTHTGNERFKCPYCDQSFYRFCELSSHKKKVHYGKKGYLCSDCGKIFKTISLLLYHRKVHTAENLYVCSYESCGKQLSTMKSLKNHLKIHEKREAMGEQGNTFTTKKRAKKGKEQKHVCLQCNVVFKTNKARLLHIKNGHLLTQTLNGQPQTIDYGSVPQQVDAEQIRRMIENLGNVQTVKQMVILPLQPESAMKPIHVNFTESEVQSTPLELPGTDTWNPKTQNGLLKILSNNTDVQPKDFVDLSVEENIVTGVSLENAETLVASADGSVPQMEPQTELDEFILELVPVPDAILLNETSLQNEMEQNVSVSQQPQTTESDVISVPQELEMVSDQPLIPVPETAEPLEMDRASVNISAAEEAVFSGELTVSRDLESFKSLLKSLQTEIIDTEKMIHCEEQKETEIDQDRSENELPIVESSQTDLSHPLPTPSTTEINQSCVMTSEEHPSGSHDPSVGLKNVTLKKKSPKKQLTNSLEPKKIKAVSEQLTQTKKLNHSSKVKINKSDQAKNKKLVVKFGPHEKKKKKSSTPKEKHSSNQTKSQSNKVKDQGQSKAFLSNRNCKVFGHKLSKDKKQKTVESQIEVERKTKQKTNNFEEKKVVVQNKKSLQGKVPKRKIKTQSVLAKTKNSDGEKVKSHKIPDSKSPDKTLKPVQKKKKRDKSADDCPKKPKIRKTQKNDFHQLDNSSVTQKSKGVEDSDKAELEKQALLLLKGHKQPQLKVHKLDATELEKSPPSKLMNLNENKKTVQKQNKAAKKYQNATKKKKAKSVENGSSGNPAQETSSVKSKLTSLPAVPKPKIVRKRKALTKIDQEIALSPPYSQLIIGCQDCGKTFSEVPALQEHMASWHSAVTVAFPDKATEVLRPEPATKSSQPNIFEIQIATDWDMETEVGEISEDREEHRLSFPALSHSPSLTPSTSFVEEKDQDDQGSKGAGSDPLLEEPVEASQVSATMSVSALVEVSEDTPETIKPNDANEKCQSKPVKSNHVLAEEGIKEELPLGVNLVTVGEQYEMENDCSSLNKVSNVSQENETISSNLRSCSQPQEPAINSEVLNLMLAEPDIKTEEVEVLQPRLDDQGEFLERDFSMKKQLAGRDQARKQVEGNRSKKHTRTENECQVVYQFCVLDSPQQTNEESEKDGSSTPHSQGVSEVDSVSGTVMDSEGTSLETSAERNGNSPEIIMEKNVCCGNPDKANVKVARVKSMLDSRKTSKAADVKTERSSQNRASHNQSSPENDSMTRNIPATVHTSQSADSQDDASHDLTSVSRHCIFYPVKEEEREHLVQVPHADQSALDPLRPAGLTGIQGHEEIRVGSALTETQHLYAHAEEGEACEEQQSSQGFLEFLSECSDADASEANNLHSEPEAEALVLSCYHGLQNNEAENTKGTETSRKSLEFSQAGRIEAEPSCNLKPITYFSKYFRWDAWKEIAVCTQNVSRLSNPVTEKEVAQYVGIHIAMGTLKFPSTKLYWEDYTKVPLIADAMSASRFCELTCKLKLACSDGHQAVQQSEERNGQEENHSSCHSNQTHNCVSSSNKDPLWKVTSLIRRVQESCQALKRTGSQGVDQYPLPFQRHPTHSLLHTVVVSARGLVVDFSLSVDDSCRENVVKKMVTRGDDPIDGMVFLCKPELSTPSMLEHLLEAGVQSAGKVGGARGQLGDEFVSSDGKLKLFRCHHGFILSAVEQDKPRSTSLVSGFERAIKAANLNRDLRSLYRTPCTNSAVSAWPQSVFWDLIDMVLVNSWIQYKQEFGHVQDPLSLMSFRLEVAKSLIVSDSFAQDSSPPWPPAPILQTPNRSSQCLETPLPDTFIRYDGFGHWPEQLSEIEEGRCRFGGCERKSRVRCLKCCVFLCISQNHNCFLKFHSQGSL